MTIRPRVAGILALAAFIVGACSASVPPTTDDLPAAPLLSNGTRDQTSVTVTWTAPVVALTIAGYELQWRAGSTMDWTPVTGISRSATSYTITGLQPQVTYEVRVRALFAATAGAWSAPTTVSTVALPAPSLAEPAASSNSITVTWTAPATSRSITAYELQWRAGATMDWTPVTDISRSATSYTITGLQPQVTYEVRVRALFATTAGAWSAPISVPTAVAAAAPTAPPPPALDPRGVCLANTHPNSIKVTWTALATDEPVTGYELQWRALFYEDWDKSVRIASTENRYTITGLQRGFFFAVRVHAWHGNVAGPWFDGRWCAIRKRGTDPRFVSFPTASDDSVSESAAEHRVMAVVYVYHRLEEYFPVAINYRLSETGGMLQSAGEHTAALSKPFPYANFINVPLVDDDNHEADSTVTVTILPGPRYDVGTLSSFTFTVADDDE